MNKRIAVTVVGGDTRSALLAEQMHADGHQVSVAALDRHDFCDQIPSIHDFKSLAAGTIIVLPLPVCKGDQLNAPLANAPHLISAVLDACPPGALVLAGAVPFSVHARAVRNRLHLIDYLTREELAIRNAVPTAEGAIQIAMEETDVTLQGTPVLVIGHGHIGSVLARKLAALGAAVTVSARNSRDFAKIEAAGMQTADTGHLTAILPGFSLVFNTVPAFVLGAAELHAPPAGALIIDLASLPGGVDPGAEVPPGVRLLPALSLPGKVAPVTAAIAVRDTIYTILREEGIL